MEVVGAMVLFGVLSWALSQAQNQAAGRNWADAARRLSMRYEPGSPFAAGTITGTRAGMQVVVDVVTEGSGKDRHSTTRYRVMFPRGLGLSLDLHPQGFLETVGVVFGVVSELTVGEQAFDELVVIQGNDPARVRAYLTSARRTRIARFFRSYPHARITDDQILVTVKGFEASATDIVNTVKASVDLAQRLFKEGPADKRIDEATRQRERGELAGAAGTLRESRRATGDDAETRAHEGEVLYAQGRYKEAAAAFEAALKLDPKDPELTQWLAAAKARVAPSAPPPARALREAATRAGGALTAEAVCKTLFGAGTTSAETAAAFEKTYEGKRVRWTGLLRWVDHTPAGSALGYGSSARAIVEVCAVVPGLAGGRAVNALVQLPGEDPGTLAGRTGTRVTFEGTLSSVDAFVRNLYVTDGVLVPGEKPATANG